MGLIHAIGLLWVGVLTGAAIQRYASRIEPGMVAITVIVLGGIAVSDLPELWRTLNTEAEKAAWVQAIGSIIAIIAAIGIAYRQYSVEARRRNEDADRRGLALAVRIRGDVEEWYRRVDKNVPPFQVETLATAWTIASTLENMAANNAFVCPRPIWESIGQLHDLKAAGTRLIRCVYKIRETQLLAVELVSAGRASPFAQEDFAVTLKLFTTAHSEVVSDLEFVMEYIVSIFP